ncbi:MAG: ectoine/hydroxyectoine ABC transporter substrate-binding protein EhuB [Minisyncoccia bacterium]
MYKKILVILMFITLTSTLFLAGCGKTTTGETTLQKAQKTGEIKIGFANEKPYAYKDDNGKLTGEAVEIAKIIFERLGIKKINGELTEFGSLISGLKAKRFDVITAGMFITPERCKQVAFANPDYSIGEALAVQKGNPKNLHSFEDIAKDPNIKVAVMAGAQESKTLKEIGVKENQIVIVNDQPSAISELESGIVDAVAMTGPSLQAMLDSAKSNKIERVIDFKDPVINGKVLRNYGAAAFRKEDTDFVKAYNEELEKMKQSGELLKILEKFGFTENEMPGDIQAKDICK